MRRQILSEPKPDAPLGRGKRASKSKGAPSGLPQFLKTSSGKPIEASVRTSAERAYGRDLKDIRIHTDTDAAESADALNARAYTTGRDIVFGAGAYQPGTSQGRSLIAHELAHVVQQSGGTIPGLSQPADSHEQAADRAARGESTNLTGAGLAPSIQRQALPSLKPPTMLARAMGSGTIDSFLTGSSALDAGQKAAIASIAANILSLRDNYPGCSVSVTGHTDAVGSEASNLTLGQARAESVRAELASDGVPPEIVITDSAGESQLKVPSTQAEPRNRRVEIQFEPESRVPGAVPKLQLDPLTPPSPTPPPPANPAAPPLFPPVLPPSFTQPHPETPAETAKRILAPVPPVKPEPRHPLFGPLIDKVDSITKAIGLPDWARDAVRDGVKAAIVKGATGAADAAMDQTSMSAEQKHAIHSIVEAAIRGQLP